MQRTFWTTGWIIGLVAILAATAAYAQASSEGVLNAISFRPLPAGASIRVQTLDNSDDNIVLVDEMEKALKARGFKLSDDGEMIMTVGTRGEIGAWTTTDRSHTLEITGQTGEHSDDTQVKLNLFDSNTGGILNQESGGLTIVTPSQYIVEIFLDNATDGKRHWEAWAAADLDQSDRQSLMRGMISPLSDVVGQTVSKQSFPIQ